MAHAVTARTLSRMRPQPAAQIHRLHFRPSIKTGNFAQSLANRKMLDARGQGVTTEAYEQYAANDILMVDQGSLTHVVPAYILP